MKYTLLIEGGITGIPMEYQGEISLPPKQHAKLMDVLEKPVAPANINLRDGMCYKISLGEEHLEKTVLYEDSNLPPEVRSFIDTIRNTKPL